MPKKRAPADAITRAHAVSEASNDLKRALDPLDPIPEPPLLPERTRETTLAILGAENSLLTKVTLQRLAVLESVLSSLSARLTAYLDGGVGWMDTLAAWSGILRLAYAGRPQIDTGSEPAPALEPTPEPPTEP